VDVEKNKRRQADGRTDRRAVGDRNGDGQSVDVEKKQERTERQTERQLVVETMTDS